MVVVIVLISWHPDFTLWIASASASSLFTNSVFPCSAHCHLVLDCLLPFDMSGLPCCHSQDQQVGLLVNEETDSEPPVAIPPAWVQLLEGIRFVFLATKEVVLYHNPILQDTNLIPSIILPLLMGISVSGCPAVSKPKFDSYGTATPFWRQKIWVCSVCGRKSGCVQFEHFW